MTQPEKLGISEMTLPDLVELRDLQKAKCTEINKEAKEAKDILDDVDHAIMEKLDALGVEGTNTNGRAVNITEEWVPTEIEWETFLPWAAENDQLHLLQRRIAVTGWREYEQITGAYPPGTQPFKQRKLSVVKRKSNKK